MRIAVTATESTLDSPVDPRFGRCPYFLIIETANFDFEAVPNPNAARANGAGIQAAQLVAEQGVRCLITGNCGPNAFNTLSAAGIEVILGGSGTVRDAVENYKAGRHRTAEQPNVAGHFGSNPTSNPTANPSEHSQPASDRVRGQGVGRGQGMGRGMGRGGGAGMGRGMGRGGGGGRGMGPGMGSSGAAPGPLSGPETWPISQSRSGADQELDALQIQAQALEEQLAALNQRMDQIQQTRTDQHLIAVVDASRCTGCGICAQACPVGAIHVDTVASVDGDLCTACGDCIVECPREAITLEKAR